MTSISMNGFKEIADKIFNLSKADETEIIFFKSKSSLTRYAENYIHQNVEDESLNIRIRTIIGKKTATVTTSLKDKTSLKNILDKVISSTKLQKDNSKLLPLPENQQYKKTDNYSSATAKVSPGKRAEKISKAVELCKKNYLQSAGILSTNTHEVAIANSKGLFGYNRSTSSDFSITAMKGTASGWNEVINKDINNIDVEKSAKIAIDKTKKSTFPVKLPEGKYDVVMEPAAVAEFILFLLWKGFNGIDYIEGTSFLKDGLNKKVFSENFTVFEDPYNPEISSLPFDFEGIPVQELVLVDKGVPKNFVTNRWIAKKTGVNNNGHAIPLPTQSAYPFALRVKNGNSSINKMIKNTKKGVLVTHFHYSNIIDPIKLLTTGMTRDGFFLIENGEITKPLKNMRFTESVLKVFSNIKEISKEVEVAKAFFGGGFLVPAMKIANFNFSSGTEF